VARTHTQSSEARVKPERDRSGRQRGRAATQAILVAVGTADSCAVCGYVKVRSRMLMHPFLSSHPSCVCLYSRVDGRGWPGQTLLQSRPSPTFAALQARVHEHWARFFGSSLKDRPSRTRRPIASRRFHFHQTTRHDPSLERTGQYYYDFRVTLMLKNNEGLTRTYNRFHDRRGSVAGHRATPQASRSDGPRRPGRLRLDRHPARVRLPGATRREHAPHLGGRDARRGARETSGAEPRHGPRRSRKQLRGSRLRRRGGPRRRRATPTRPPRSSSARRSDAPI
jgi:hypothetical protein